MESLEHQPVMLKSVLSLLIPKNGEEYLDLTAGYGGHAAAIIRKVGSEKCATLVDRDSDAVAALRAKFKDAKILHQDFASAADNLSNEHSRYDLILLDLGLSTPQLLNAPRGFSLRLDAPLDMRMDSRQQLSAGTVVNTYPKAELENLIAEYGEEPRARSITEAIVRARPISTTKELASIVLKAKLKPNAAYRRIHPATKTFQAIRIEVNNELMQLKWVLPKLPKLLNTGGRVGIISFHSLEDREVKHFFKGCETLKVLTKKPLSGREHDPQNRQARSAKLRVAIKIKNNKGQKNGHKNQSTWQ